MSLGQIVMVLVLAGMDYMFYEMTSAQAVKEGYRKTGLIGSIIITVFVFLASSFSINITAVLVIWPLAFLICHFLIQVYDYLFVNVLEDSAE